ncbi:SDR family NAD(P)-dependent oxidoreductase [Variovorax sp. LT1R16]|uniref:SDR family NAD(P)-dependent oxidoreductase n=1 Tax=Variovorax sp. LT1R16 TaxID=3443728 RepID=UPI003F446051
MADSSVHLGVPRSPRFAGKVAIVTGAGSVGAGWGNGRAIAVALASEEAQVIAVDRDMASMRETLEAAGEAAARIHPVVCDVTSSGAVADMVAAVTSQLGKIDVLVNNVGGPAPGGPVEMEESVWDSQVDLNLKSVFLMCKHVLPGMLNLQSGAIVNVASTSGIRWTGNAQVAYAATKAGVIQFSRVVAVQHAARGIRVNSVVPGQLHTPLVAGLAAGRTSGDLQALLDQRIRRIPAGFFGDGRDTAAAVLFLASDEARFVNGTELVVDGAMSARCD